MFLKSLEIRGFKSFADKTELDFEEGITAVVGPNGSGKSNISDAVKWVLGEQSVKNLRGGKMQDVIFSGTQYRKPVGLAQVTLVLDNNDMKIPIEYNEVTITRRLFRSGESEYYLNNTKCRLKDINELFMDTGIGKEGYSIIGQGKIDAVLSGRPEERRGILEEAAGIVKFKTRKIEAERKLQNTEENIQRINDIFSTYEERLEPLKIENEKAKKFIDLSNKLKSKEVTVVLHNLESSENKIHLLKKQIEERDLKSNELLQKKNEVKKSLTRKNEELENFEMQNNNERKKYYENKTKSQNLISEIGILKEKEFNIKNSMVRNSNTLKQLDDKINILNKEKEKLTYEKLKNEQSTIEEEILKFEKEIKESNLKIENNDKEIQRTKEYEIELISEITKNKNELTMLKSDIDTLKNKLSECKNACKTYENSIKIKNTTKDELKKEILKINSKMNDYEEKIKEYKKFIISENRILLKNENKLKDIIRKYNKVEARCSALKNLEKQYEGYTRSVKNLMHHIEQNKIPKAKDKAYVLGEIIKVEKEFETAIEIALGSSISNIITENENIAKDLITYLKKNHLGRTTFLPMNIIKGRKIAVPENIKNIDGYIGIGSDLIGFNEKYENAINYVLGRTIVARDMDSALFIAKKSGHRFKIVTLEGEVVNVGGALTGGSIYNKNVSIISRKREIEELSSNLKESKINIEKLNHDLRDKKENIKNMNDACLKLKDEIYYENIEKTKIKGKINVIESESEKLKRDLNVSNNEITLIRETLDQSNVNLENKVKKIEELTNLEKNNTQKIYDLENNFKTQKKELVEKNESITNLKIKKAKIDENTSNVENNISRIENELKSIKEEIDSLNKENKSFNEKIRDFSEKIIINENTIKKIKASICDLEDGFKDGEIRRAKIKNDINKLSQELEEITLEYDKFEKGKNNIEVLKARQEVEKDNLYKKLNEEMKLTYAEALKFKLDNIIIDDCKKDIGLYKNEISKLGVVNLGSIEEYEKLYEKYNFMKTQKEDLTKAKEQLENVVSEMTQKMKKVFGENFSKLRKNFNETFKELFKGGYADLILEGEDELSSNIEINVQPPGKKLQNINLMSGGEKGLSAIALLFAILKMKPTPFCILDEIEAALDDANVNRYSEFLRRLSNRTQFIIITHRKGSMEACDILYGVTMEEKGVSKIVSVDLSKS